MRYAILRNGALFFAHNPILSQGKYIGNPSDALYLAEGYKPVVYADRPGTAPADCCWEEVWAEEEKVIRLSWVLMAQTDDEEISDTEAVTILLGGENG